MEYLLYPVLFKFAMFYSLSVACYVNCVSRHFICDRIPDLKRQHMYHV